MHTLYENLWNKVIGSTWWPYAFMKWNWYSNQVFDIHVKVYQFIKNYDGISWCDDSHFISVVSMSDQCWSWFYAKMSMVYMQSRDTGKITQTIDRHVRYNISGFGNVCRACFKSSFNQC